MDKELLEELRAGDSLAFEKLVRTHEKKVYNIALRMSGNEQDALDISQEVFIRVFRSLPSFHGDSALSTWIYRIAVNMSIDHGRKKKKRANTVSLSQYDEGGEEYALPVASQKDDPQRVLADKEAQAAYIRALDGLPPDQKQTVILRDINGLSYEEISQVLDCSLGTVKSKLCRARGKLRKYFRY